MKWLTQSVSVALHALVRNDPMMLQDVMTQGQLLYLLVLWEVSKFFVLPFLALSENNLLLLSSSNLFCKIPTVIHHSLQLENEGVFKFFFYLFNLLLWLNTSHVVSPSTVSWSYSPFHNFCSHQNPLRSSRLFAEMSALSDRKEELDENIYSFKNEVSSIVICETWVLKEQAFYNV